MLEKKEKALRRENWITGAIWIYMVVLSTGFLIVGGNWIDKPKGAYSVGLACFMLLYGLVYLIKLLINGARVDLLKEVKQVQLQVLELRAAIAEGGAPKSSQP